MAKHNNVGDYEQDAYTPVTKKVRNRNDYRVELLVNGEVKVFPPKSTVEVPESFAIPTNIGLYTV